jgi:hypothetical protein
MLGRLKTVMVDDVVVGELSRTEIQAFRRDGFIRLEEAFPRSLALRCCDLLWEQIEEDPADPSTWHRPVVRVGSQTDRAFSDAAQSRRWVRAIREVMGPNTDPTPWMGGTFAIRFPVDEDPGDDGWHIEGSYLGPDDWWWTNYWSKDRALLMLVLFSDVGDSDAPTRIRIASHVVIPETLSRYGEAGVNQRELQLPSAVDACDTALATGSPGDVYLCHPFLVHAAQRHRGQTPRFIAQPGVPWKNHGRLNGLWPD